MSANCGTTVTELRGITTKAAIGAFLSLSFALSKLIVNLSLNVFLFLRLSLTGFGG